MNITVIPSDSLIIKDGVALSVVFSSQENMHALQWYGAHGKIEFTDGPSEHFTDPEIIAPFVAAFNTEAARPQAIEASLPSPSSAQIRASVIVSRLTAIDVASIRALRAKVIGKGKGADDAKLSALDAEADTLRAELAAL